MTRPVLLILPIFLLGACSGSFSTNFGQFAVDSTKKNIAKSEVKELTFKQLHARYFQSLGAVETDVCVKEREQPMPSENEMKKRLKLQAFEYGANAIVFDQCKRYSDFRQCKRYQICRAQIFNADI